MKQFTVVIGIEHLMTGVQVRSAKGDVLTFDRESPSMVRVSSDSPIDIYWPVKQSWSTSTENEIEHGRYSDGEAQWYAQVMALAMVRTDEAQVDTHPDVFPLPAPVVKAMRRKFGALANTYIGELRKYSGGFYGFTHAGMFHGVEPDGYIHT